MLCVLWFTIGTVCGAFYGAEYYSAISLKEFTASIKITRAYALNLTYTTFIHSLCSYAYYTFSFINAYWL